MSANKEGTEDGGGEDEDVLWEGSPLYKHLQKEGMVDGAQDEVQVKASMTPRGALARHRRPPAATSKRMCTVWPKHRAVTAQLEVEVARRVLESELLVQEDEDFVNNFILTEEAIELARKSQQDLESGGSSSGLSEVLLLSGSLAAAAATVLYLSERTRLAATVASVLPTALAAVSTAKSWTKEKGSEQELVQMEKEQFEKLVDTLLGDMKLFKQLVRKSLNLLQGMELMQSGYVFGVNSTTGGPVNKANGDGNVPGSGNNDDSDQSGLDKVMESRLCFPALRRASYRATVELLRAYRQSVSRLMEVAPLEEHIDLKDHYLAFVDLSEFGISDDDFSEKNDCADVTLKELKDAVQLSLVQQSEYLRRFALAFSDRNRDEVKQQQMDKAGLLKQVRDLVGTLKKINSKLSKVFEYHQALGVVPNKPKSLVLKRHQTIDLIPLRSVYTSLFSTGLHLQNSLLKVRQLEKAFDSIEKNKGKRKAATDSVSSMLPSEESLAEWLVSFDVIQKELNACVGCLDEGMSSIEVLKHSGSDSPGRSSKASGDGSSGSVSSLSSPSVEEEEKKVAETISEGTATERVDEVYEAVIGSEDEERRKKKTRDAGEQTDDEASDVEKQRLRMQTEQSERMLKELREVLAVKAKEREKREAAALARSGKKEEEEENSTSNVCQINPADLSVRPKKPPRTRNGDARVPFSTLVPSTRERPACNGSKGELGARAKKTEEPADGKAFLLNAKDGNEFGGDLSNDFEDSFSDYMSKKDAEDAEDGLSCSSSSSSDQDTVKSVPSEKPRDRQSSSSYGETDDDEQESIDEDEEEEEEDASCVSQSSSFKRRRSRLKSTPSLDSLRELKLHQLKIKKGASDGVVSPGDCHSLSELRSISSPDIKRLAVTGAQDNPAASYSSSPYESLDALPPRLRVAAALSSSAWRVEQGERMSLSDGDSDTSEEEEGNMRQKVLKTYRRPLRPAANKKRPARSRPTLKEDAEERNGHAVAMGKKEEEVDSGGSNTYMSKNHKRDEPLFLPPVKRPFGFDAAVALQAATKAVSGGFNGLQMRGGKKENPAEEVFGDSSSE